MKADGFEVYKSKAKGLHGWRFHIDGEILAIGRQYFLKDRRREYLGRVIDALPDAKFRKPNYRNRHPFFTVYQGNGRRWRWTLRGGNYKILACSPKGYDSETEANNEAEFFRIHATTKKTREAL